MVPSSFVALDQLPKTASGKLDRRALPRPGPERPELSTEYLPPRTEIERTIAGLWQEALGIERVGLHDNFFSLGGHSLLLVQIHLLLRDRYRDDLDVTDLFRFPTVSTLAAYLAGDDGSTRLDAADDRGAKQRSALQDGARRMQEARARQER
jgi:acyl carrier protein